MSSFQTVNRISIVSSGIHCGLKEKPQITNQVSNQVSRNTHVTSVNFGCHKLRRAENKPYFNEHFSSDL